MIAVERVKERLNAFERVGKRLIIFERIDEILTTGKRESYLKW